jgi:hypothetical protein
MSKKLVIASLLSLELGSAPELPDDPEDCWVTVIAELGFEGAGADIFNFYFVTVNRLAQLVSEKRHVLGRHTIVVERFDWDVAREAVEAVLSEVSGETWEEVGPKLAQYGEWEFDDYQPYQP